MWSVQCPAISIRLNSKEHSNSSLTEDLPVIKALFGNPPLPHCGAERVERHSSRSSDYGCMPLRSGAELGSGRESERGLSKHGRNWEVKYFKVLPDFTLICTKEVTRSDRHASVYLYCLKKTQGSVSHLTISDSPRPTSSVLPYDLFFPTSVLPLPSVFLIPWHHTA